MSARGQSGLKSKFFYVGALFCLNVGIVSLMWRFRGSRSILALFSLAWVLLVTLFAWEIVTRAKLLDRMVQARTDALEASNRHLAGLLRQLRTFHRISYEMNQHLDLEQITGSFVRQLHRNLPQVQGVWLWLERALLQLDRDRLPRLGPLTRPLDLAARAGDDFGSPDELAPLPPGTPLLAEWPESRGVTVVGDLARQAERWGWRWLADTPMESFAGFYLHIGDRLLGVLGVFSMVPLSGEFIRQLHLSVNQLSVALEKSRLLRQMQRRAAELAAVNQELRQLDAMKDWFVSSVSHELRTPLTNIRSYSEILENYADLDPEERKEFAEIIREESERLSIMINNVLDLAKIASGEVRLQPRSVDICAVVDRCCRLFRREAEERDISFEAITPAETPPVHADEEAVVRVLNNLIGNAFKFTPEEGTIRVGVETGGRRAEQRGFVSVTVSDTGVGISLEDQQKIFGKFTQVGASLTDKPPGTGIGLAICREIVEESGGEIWVQSAPGEGSMFGFTLRVASSVQEPEPDASERSSV